MPKAELNKDTIKAALNAFLESLFSEASSEDRGEARPAPRHSFTVSQNLVTTKEMVSADGETVIPLGTKAVYIGQNADKPKDYLDVAWLSQAVNDNGKSWKAKHFRAA